MKEVWENINGYEGRYVVSNLGRIKSLSIKTRNRNGPILKKERIRKTPIGANGYPVIGLPIRGRVTQKYVHRIVAENFINNPLGKPEVNHKNGIKSDNRVENLEWCTGKENISHSIANGLINPARGINNGNYGKFGAANHTSKGVLMINVETGVVIKSYGGISEASRETGIYRTNISAVCKGKRKQCGGYGWSYIKK